jgi:hypothetical protein
MNRTLIEQIGGEWIHLVCPNGGKTEEWDATETGAEVMYSPDWTPPLGLVREFVEACDVVVCVETDYRSQLAELAASAGKLSVLIPMYEWLGNPMRCPNFDRYICTSRITYRKTHVDDSRKRYLPWPVDTGLFRWPNVKDGDRPLDLPIKTVLHCAGHGGIDGRKGTLEAVQGFLKTTNPKLKMILRSQVSLDKIDPDLPRLCESDTSTPPAWTDKRWCLRSPSRQGCSPS